MRRFIIDTDTASDDAVALVMALTYPDVTIEAITVVCGNMPLEQGIQNALYTVELCGKQVPVYPGAVAPLLRPLEAAHDYHGQDGLGDIGLPLSGRVPAERHAVDVLRETIRRYPSEITLVALGPLTNLALALTLEPELASLVRECIVMGGSLSGGNVTPVAEYNAWVDPEAAKIVFASGIPIKLVDWQLSSRYGMLTPEEEGQLQAQGTSLATFCVDIQRVAREVSQKNLQRGIVLADPLTMAIALEPETATETGRFFVDVATDSLTRGQTIVDIGNVLQREPNVEVVLTASHERFVQLLHRAVR